MKRSLLISLSILAACSTIISCSPWTAQEQNIINSATPLHVLSVDDPSELKTLREASTYLSEKQLLSTNYEQLCAKMLLTVTDSTQNGVGIAAPQVGINKRLIAVQRFDKEGEPWEVFPNICITAKRGEEKEGPEACLSVPGKRGIVNRSYDIDIHYSCVKDGEVSEVSENVVGWTAVIFQHECDHLEGIIYTDKASTIEADE